MGQADGAKRMHAWMDGWINGCMLMYMYIYIYICGYKHKNIRFSM